MFTITHADYVHLYRCDALMESCHLLHFMNMVITENSWWWVMMISVQYEIILCSDNIAAMIMLTRAPAASHFMIPSSDHQIFSTQILSFQIYWLQPMLTRNRKCPTLNPPPIILAIFPILWTENSKVDHATPSNTLRNILSTFQKK